MKLKNFSRNFLSLANELTGTRTQLLKYEPPLPSTRGEIAAYTIVRDPSSVFYTLQVSEKNQQQQQKYIKFQIYVIMVTNGQCPVTDSSLP